VECIDHNVGRVVDYLESIGELDNTFILFMSDNGAEGGAHEANPAFKGGPMAHLQRYYDNSLDNLGNRNSFCWYGPRWAQAATAPSRMYKSYTTEGGIRVPLIAKLPQGYESPVPLGGITHNFSTIMDIAPTFLEMAGVAHPAPHWKGREVVKMRGKSIVPWLQGKTDSIHSVDFVEGWEMSGRAAVRKGNWKAVYLPSTRSGPSLAGADRWELFDLETDKGEVNDLSAKHPEILKELLKLWDQYVLETGVVPLNPALGEYIAATEEQMPDDGWMEYEYWKKGARDVPDKFFVTPKRFDSSGIRVA
jgi:arylsulfatase A-like enzyme